MNTERQADAATGGRRTRVCIVGSGWHFLSGISYYTCRMANALTADHDVSVILMRRLVPRRLYPGRARVGESLSTLTYHPDVACFDGVDYYWVPSIVRAVRFLLEQRPDVVVFEWWTGSVLHSYLALAAAARALGARVVIEFHETLDTGEQRVPLAPSYVRALSRPLLSMACGAAVHSEFDIDELASRYALDPGHMAVVPHGPNDHLAEGDGIGIGQEDGICRLLYFGTVRPYKGVEYLIQAFDGLDREDALRYRLTIVGETWEGWTLPAELVQRARHRDLITFVNRYVHDDELAAYLRQASAVVLPYLRSSASGPLHMTMSCGLPVVVSAVGGLVEAAGEYEGARFVRPRDVDDLRAALLELPAMGGRRYADPHSWARSASRLAGLFDRSGRLRV